MVKPGSRGVGILGLPGGSQASLWGCWAGVARLRHASWLLGGGGPDLSALLSLEPGAAGLLGARLLTCSCMGRALGIHEEHCHLLFQGSLPTTSGNYRRTHTGKLAVKQSNSLASAVENCSGNRRERSGGWSGGAVLRTAGEA